MSGKNSALRQELTAIIQRNFHTYYPGPERLAPFEPSPQQTRRQHAGSLEVHAKYLVKPFHPCAGVSTSVTGTA